MKPSELFLAALEFATEQEQDAFVNSQTEQDAELRAEVKSLLRAHREAAESFLEVGSLKTKQVVDTVETLSLDLAKSASESAKAIERIQVLLGAHLDPNVIATIDHYCLLSVQGAGGFGLVFKARDLRLDRIVAIKMLVSTMTLHTQHGNQFLQEARLAAAVVHENVVAIHSVHDVPIPYIVMEYVDGPTLQTYIDSEGPLDILTLIQISQQIAAGLAAAHARGIVHRDLKPGNILVQTEGHLKTKLTDFGLAHPIDESSSSTQTQFIGTPLYASPEQAGSDDTDTRSDLFSLGSVIYFMATGRPPFPAKSVPDILHRVLQETPQPIHKIRPGVPSWFGQIVERLHAKDPAQRIQSADELVRLLSEHAGQPVSRAVPPFGTKQWRIAAIGVAILAASLWFALFHPSMIGPSEVENPTATPQADASNRSTSNAGSNAGDRYAAEANVVKTVVPTRTDLESLPPWSLPAGSPSPLTIPSTAEQAKSIQSQWAKHLNQDEFVSTSIGLHFALVPPGDFDKTFTRNRDGEIHASMPTIRYRLTKPYRMATTEVTVAQFQAFVEETGYKTDAEVLGFACGVNTYLVKGAYWQNPGRAIQPNEPVCMVTENDAQQFCNWLSKKDNRRFRLPTEAEWIHSLRAGSDSRFVYGPDHSALEPAVWCFENSGVEPKPVGGLSANPLGLHDMLGNMWERTSDWMDHVAMFPYLQRIDPAGSPISNTIGGCFIEQRNMLHADLIVGNWSSPSPTIGFRVAEEIGADEPGAPSYDNGEAGSQSWASKSLLLSTGRTLSATALTSEPVKLDGVLSWSIDIAGIYSGKPSPPAWNTKTKQWFVGSDGGGITVLNESGEFVEKLLGPSNHTEAKVSHDGDWLAVKDSNGSMVEHLYVWYWPERKLKAVLPFDGRFWEISPDSKRIVFAKQNRGPWNNWGAYELDLESGDVRSLLIPRLIDQFAWTNRPDRIVCQTRIDEDANIELLEYPSLRLINTIPTHRISVWSISPDGKLLAVPNMAANTMRIRDLGTLEVTTSFPLEADAQIQSCQWYADNDRMLLTGQKSQEVVRTSDGQTIFSLPVKGTLLSQIQLCEEPGVIIGTATSSNRVQVFDAQTGTRRGEWKNLADNYESVPFLSDTTLLFAQDHSAVAFDLKQPKQRANLSWPPAPWAMDTKRQKVATIENGVLNQTEIGVGSKQPIDVSWMADVTPRLLAYSNDCRKIACLVEEASGHFKCFIVDAMTGEKVCELLGHRIFLKSLEWSGDDRHIATLTHPDAINLVVWNAASGEPHSASQVPVPPRTVLHLYDDQLKHSPSGDAYFVALGTAVYHFDLDSKIWSIVAHNKLPTVERELWMDPSGTQIINSFGGRFHHLCNAKDFRFLGEVCAPCTTARWTRDGALLAMYHPLLGTRTYRSKDLSQVGTVIPSISGGHWLATSPSGHYRGSDRIEALLSYVVLHVDGSQQTYTPTQFDEKFGWKNRPETVVLAPQE